MDSVSPKPHLYALSQKGRYLNGFTFAFFLFRGMIHSTVSFFMGIWIFSGEYLSSNGETLDTQTSFIPLYASIIVLQLLIVLSESHSFTWLHWLSLVGSLASFVSTFAVYSELSDLDFYGSFVFCFRQPGVYLGILVVAAFPFLLHCIIASFKFWQFPNKLQLQRGFSLRQAQFRRQPNVNSQFAKSFVPRC